MLHCLCEKHHSTLKTMTNAELTLDQLTAISGGVTVGPDGSTCTDRHLTKFLKKFLGSGSPGLFDPTPRGGLDPIGGTSAGPVSDDV